jgi:hypothetical protein
MVDKKKLAEIFNLPVSEVETIFEAALVYQCDAQNEGYRDWCKMYDGIHREMHGETAIRNWLAFRRWQKSRAQPSIKEFMNLANELSNTSTDKQFRYVLTHSQLIKLYEFAQAGAINAEIQTSSPLKNEKCGKGQNIA